MTDEEIGLLYESAKVVLSKDGMRDWGADFWRLWPEDKDGARRMAGRIIHLTDRLRAAEARGKELETVPKCSESRCDAPAWRAASDQCSYHHGISENDD